MLNPPIRPPIHSRSTYLNKLVYGHMSLMAFNHLTCLLTDSDLSDSESYASDIAPMLFYAGRPVPMWLSEDSDLPTAWGGGDPFPAAGMYVVTLLLLLRCLPNQYVRGQFPPYFTSIIQNTKYFRSSVHFYCSIYFHVLSSGRVTTESKCACVNREMVNCCLAKYHHNTVDPCLLHL